MRIIFIPGLGEEKWIFDKIKPFIKGEKVFIDNFRLLGEVFEDNLNALTYADFLIKEFTITKDDVIVGHSLGGWVAFFIKYRVACSIIQLSSFTDVKKAFKPANRNIIYWLAQNGIGLNKFVMKLILYLGYRDDPSSEVIKAIFTKLMHSDKNTLVKQLKVVFNPVVQPSFTSPDLRMHARKDHLVRPPDESYIEIPGDHFALYTFPNLVYPEINHFLNSLHAQ